MALPAGEVGRRGTVFQEMFIAHPAVPWVSQQEITHFWKLIHELSIEVKERAEFSKLAGRWYFLMQLAIVLFPTVILLLYLFS